MRTKLIVGALLLVGACGADARGAGADAEDRSDQIPASLVSRTRGDANRPVEDREPRHVALLIGIGDYEHFTFDGPPGMTDLEGPPNDLERVRTSLRRWGFDGEDVRVLGDRAASRQGILDGFAWLAERASNPDDVVVIYYSGHGAYVGDEDGDEALLDPNDRYDEVLVPWDATDIETAGELILDDQIRVALEQLGTTNVTMFVDACYSGTMTRGAGEVPLRRARGPAGPRGDQQSSAVEALDHPEHTLITAASARQVAEELPFRQEGNEVFGVLTYHLTRALDGADPDTRYDQLMREIRAGVSGTMVPQTPQLEGDRNARIFRVTREVARRPFAIVSPGSGATTTLDVGAVHGVRVGARYDVFGPDEMEFRGQPIAQVVIERVGETESVARIDSGNAPPAGARAVLARVPPGASSLETLAVYVNPTVRAMAGAAAMLEGLSWVQTADSASAAAHVTLAAGRPEVRVRDIPVPALGDGTGPSTSICEPLSRAFAIHALDLVRNPQPPAELEIRIRVLPTGTRPGEARATLDTAYVGGHYDIWARVDAPDNSEFYFSAGTQGFTSPSVVFFPNPDVLNQPFQLNTWVRLVPRVLMTEPSGVEVVKAVANSEQFDLHSLHASFPSCTATRGKGDATGGWGTDPSAVEGWSSLEHRVIILPESARR